MTGWDFKSKTYSAHIRNINPNILNLKKKKDALINFSSQRIQGKISEILQEFTLLYRHVFGSLKIKGFIIINFYLKRIAHKLKNHHLSLREFLRNEKVHSVRNPNDQSHNVSV